MRVRRASPVRSRLGRAVERSVVEYSHYLDSWLRGSGVASGRISTGCIQGGTVASTAPSQLLSSARLSLGRLVRPALVTTSSGEKFHVSRPALRTNTVIIVPELPLNCAGQIGRIGFSAGLNKSLSLTAA